MSETYFSIKKFTVYSCVINCIDDVDEAVRIFEEAERHHGDDYWEFIYGMLSSEYKQCFKECILRHLIDNEFYALPFVQVVNCIILRKDPLCEYGMDKDIIEVLGRHFIKTGKGWEKR